MLVPFNIFVIPVTLETSHPPKSLLNKDEFLSTEKEFNYYNVDGNKKQLLIKSNSLAFTYCQVPIIYNVADENKIFVTTNDEIIEFEGLKLDTKLSNSIFNRDGRIQKIEVKIKL